MAYLSEMDGEFGFIDPEAVAKRGAELSERYNSAGPFPHVVIDDFMPEEILERCLREFPVNISEGGVRFDREQERYKTHFSPDVLSPWYRSLFYGFNSRPFIRVLENITGIKGLIPDPFFLGAGLHEISQGGHLSIHADFNHHKPMNLERRINLLIYLNKEWLPEYGGQLELWDRSMNNKVVDVVPLFNRCVIFNTDSDSFHGNPEIINHPKSVPRKSIALYYYTSTWDTAKRDHTTQFKVRTGTKDAVDVRVKYRELMQDLLPPMLHRKLTRGKRSVPE